jgi:hypothetical protein
VLSVSPGGVAAGAPPAFFGTPCFRGRILQANAKEGPSGYAAGACVLPFFQNFLPRMLKQINKECVYYPKTCLLARNVKHSAFISGARLQSQSPGSGGIAAGAPNGLFSNPTRPALALRVCRNLRQGTLGRKSKLRVGGEAAATAGDSSHGHQVGDLTGSGSPTAPVSLTPASTTASKQNLRGREAARKPQRLFYCCCIIIRITRKKNRRSNSNRNVFVNVTNLKGQTLIKTSTGLEGLRRGGARRLRSKRAIMKDTLSSVSYFVKNNFDCSFITIKGHSPGSVPYLREFKRRKFGAVSIVS